jgi:hypothetical protein
MRRKCFSRHGIIILPVLFLFIHAPCFAVDRDTSLRTDLNFNYTINEQFRSVTYAFVQADKNISNYDYFEWGTGLQYQTPVKWLSFLVYYQQGYSKIEQSNWSLEQRPSMNVNTSTTLSSFKISNQIRYEYRFTPDWNDYRIKNTLEISLPDIFLQPYICWELYYENRDKALMLSRTKFGIIKNVGSHISMGPYYRIDFSNIDYGWEWSRNLIGIQLTLKY